jgi:hypothetical protein
MHAGWAEEGDFPCGSATPASTRRQLNGASRAKPQAGGGPFALLFSSFPASVSFGMQRRVNPGRKLDLERRILVRRGVCL